MAAKEMYDYLSIKTADYDYVLAIPHSKQTIESASKNQQIFITDDGSSKVVSLDSTSYFYVKFPYSILTESNSGTIFDLWNDSSKANGMAKTFKWYHPQDGHTYVVRFACNLTRIRQQLWNFGYSDDICLKVEGVIADA